MLWKRSLRLEAYRNYIGDGFTGFFKRPNQEMIIKSLLTGIIIKLHT